MIDLIINKKAQLPTSATRLAQQQWFSVCIFPLRRLNGLIPIHRDNPRPAQSTMLLPPSVKFTVSGQHTN